MARQSSRSNDAALTFLVLEETQLAYAAISELVEEAPSRGRLLLLHGPAGCGKSHLASLVVREAKRRVDAVTVEIPAPELLVLDTEKLGERMGLGDIASPHQRRRIVVCEDIQAVARQAAAQANLVFLIDEAKRFTIDVVLTANKAPGDLPSLSNRLRSRLRGGSCVLVKPPSLASREKLLEHFGSHLQIPMTSSAVRLLARQLATSPRELLGAVKRFDELGRLHRATLDAAFARAFLTHEIVPQTVTIDEVAKAVAREFDITLAEIRSAARDHQIKTARQCAMFLARELTGEKFAAIGEYFTHRSHSTVMHACQRIARELADDAALRQRLGTIRQSFDAGR